MNFPDALGASLLDPVTLKSLVPTVPLSNTDSFYTRDLVDGVIQGLAGPGVTLSPASTSLPLDVSVDVSSLGGQDARIIFRLIGGGDAFNATAGIANVSVNGTVSAIPEPGSLVLASTVCLALVVYSRLRRKFAA